MVINTSYTDDIETDICIIGAGPAGISLAREFVGENREVTLLESGDVDFDPETQQLAAGKVVGDELVPPVDACNRQFGGNSNVWHIKVRENQLGLRYAPFDKIDFEKRDTIPNSGWPIDREHLNPYYEKAQAVCQAGSFHYDVAAWESKSHQRLSLDENVLETRMFQYAPGEVFYRKYYQELVAAPNIKILTKANVVEIITNDSGKVVTELRVASLGGKEIQVKAKVFILACGGFENARLLLMSNRQQSAGLGNKYDVVGRYYHDHPLIVGGSFIPKNPELFNQVGLYDLRQINGTPVMGFLRLSKKVLEREGLLNSNTMLYPRPSKRKTLAIESFINLVNDCSQLLKEASFEQKRLKNLPGNLVNTIKGLDGVAQAVYLAKWHKQSLVPYLCHDGWQDSMDNSRLFDRFELRHIIEQSPDPNNRVKLSRDRDALGCPKLEVNWRWHRDDAENFGRSLGLISQELQRSGLGEFQLDLDPDGLPIPVRPIGSCHLMGTTRMSDNPRQGVVDSNCQVHGINNLFVAGSSTFPTGSHANPTLTVVAMSLRLADFMKSSVLKNNVEYSATTMS